MGSVAKIRKRDEAIGGSARAYNQERARNEAKLEACWKLPFVGGFFRDCLKDRVEAMVLDTSKQSLHSRSFDDNATDVSTDLTYAMKSIHLSRVTDPTFVLELKNEIEILKSLDHRTFDAYGIAAVLTFTTLIDINDCSAHCQSH